jgi:two-component system chemotaxis response regulator CheB
LPTHDIIVIGASAGGVEVLGSLVSGLPADFPAAVFVVVHFPAQSPSVLPRILTRAGPLPAAHARHNEVIEPGRIYVATPDCHLLVHPGVVHVVRGPRENHCRPAIDPLFRSAALAYGPRVVGVILSGVLGDGTAGLLSVKQRGGVTIVQDPADALFPEMPRNAMEYVKVNYVLPRTDIAPTLVRLAHETVVDGPAAAASEGQRQEVALAEVAMATIETEKRSGTPSVFGCPECGGTLWELEDGELLRFRCRTGHAFSSDSLFTVQSEALEGALWAALRGLEENAALAHRMAARARERNFARSAENFAERARAAEQQAAIIRKVLVESKPQGAPAPEEPAK